MSMPGETLDEQGKQNAADDGDEVLSPFYNDYELWTQYRTYM